MPKATQKRLTLKQRAEAIINDTRGAYDVDTRDAIRHMLEEKAGGLAEMVKRAEGGEEVWDLTRDQSPPPAENNAPGDARESAESTADERRELEHAAQFVYDLCNGSGAPDFITDAVVDALNEAAAACGVKIWRGEDGDESDLSRSALADLFAKTRFYSLRQRQQKSSAGLAVLISTVLNHPDCPTEVYNGLSGGMTEVFSDLTAKGQPSFVDSARYIDIILSARAERGANG